MCILPQFKKKKELYVQRLSPCRKERNPFLALKDEWLAGVKAKPKGQGAGELGWDRSLQGMETMLDFGLYLRGNGTLKVGKGIIRQTDILEENHISNQG